MFIIIFELKVIESLAIFSFVFFFSNLLAQNLLLSNAELFLPWLENFLSPTQIHIQNSKVLESEVTWIRDSRIDLD
jgi:hypothetical protein